MKQCRERSGTKLDAHLHCVSGIFQAMSVFQSAQPRKGGKVGLDVEPVAVVFDGHTHTASPADLTRPSAPPP